MIFKYVFHLFIISLDGELPTRQSGIVASYGELVGIHRTDVFGNGYPEVGRHRQRSGGQQMHILCHARIGCFGRISLSEVIAGGKAGLQRIVAFPLCVEQRCAYTCIQTEPGVYIEIVFGVKGDFLSAHGMAVAGIVNRIFLEGAIIYILYFRGSYSRTERMVDVLCTELDVVLRHGGVVKVHTRTPVTDTGVELGGVIVSVLYFIGDSIGIFHVSVQPHLIFVV